MLGLAVGEELLGRGVGELLGFPVGRMLGLAVGEEVLGRGAFVDVFVGVLVVGLLVVGACARTRFPGPVNKRSLHCELVGVCRQRLLASVPASMCSG